MKYRGVLLLFFLLPALGIFAQTAEELDRLLETEAAGAGTAARFILGSAGLLPKDLSGDDAEKAAVLMAREQGWLRETVAEHISLKETAFLVMNAFGLKGGVLYSLARNPRYAYRELLYHGLIQGRADPDFTVSGPRLLQIIGRAIEYTEENSAAGEAHEKGAAQ